MYSSLRIYIDMLCIHTYICIYILFPKTDWLVAWTPDTGACSLLLYIGTATKGVHRLYYATMVDDCLKTEPVLDSQVACK